MNADISVILRGHSHRGIWLEPHTKCILHFVGSKMSPLFKGCVKTCHVWNQDLAFCLSEEQIIVFLQNSNVKRTTKPDFVRMSLVTGFANTPHRVSFS